MDRKAQIRQYKETPRPMGIFQVRNTASGRSFIGGSKNLPAILNRHAWQLKLGVHPNQDLQRDWNELGADAFAFQVLDTLTMPDQPDYDPADDLSALEGLWFAKLAESGESAYNAKASRARQADKI